MPYSSVFTDDECTFLQPVEEQSEHLNHELQFPHVRIHETSQKSMFSL